METNQILLERFITDHPTAASQAIEKMNEDVIVLFFNKIPEDLAANILSKMYSYKGAKCLELMETKISVRILEKIDVNTAELLLRQCNEVFRNKMVNGLSSKKSIALKQKLSFPANSIGASMRPVALSLRKEITIKEVISIGKQEKRPMPSQVYVVDEEGKLEGVVKTNDLLNEKNSSKLSSVMITEIPKFFAEANIKSVADHPGWLELQDIAVIDSSERLIGTLNFKATRQNKSRTVKDATSDLVETSNALGELYRIGMTGFLQSISK